MQLATSQRPHPPPVPPRPSRQVVAEALKRSPRPPCPTRQAPPPPNTKPWRSEDHETSYGPRAGHTVVYESSKDQRQSSIDESIRSTSESSAPNELRHRSSISPRENNDRSIESGLCNSTDKYTGNTVVVGEKREERGCGPSKVTSERNEAENQRERHIQLQPQRRSNSNELPDRENSIIHLKATDSGICSNTDRRIVVPRDNSALHEESESGFAAAIRGIGKKTGVKHNGKDDGSCDDEIKKSSVSILPSVTKDRILRNINECNKNFEQEHRASLNGSLNESIAKSIEDFRTANNREEVKKIEKRSLSFENKSESQGNSKSGKRLSATPTKIEKNSIASRRNDSGSDKAVVDRDANEETISRRGEEDAAGSATTISSDDCATVVVIDEPERKIAFSEDNDNIHHQDWLEAGVRYSSTKITLPGDEPTDRVDDFAQLDDHYNRHKSCDNDSDEERSAYNDLDFSSIRERIAMSTLQGLPPLPRSLSGFNLSEGRREAGEPPPPPARSSSRTSKNIKSTQPSSSRPSPPGRQLTTLDTQLAILRKEMFGLRQLDLSLLSQLWSLNESIQEFRQLLQEQEDRAPSPSPSSEEGDDTSYGNHPPPPPRRPAPLLHHHRPPRPPRPLRPPASDESPSSEEYGAV